MNSLQKTALSVALNSHNLLLTGAGGSGKTYVVKHMVNYIKQTEKRNVHITASTGMASTCYKEFGCTTLHKWCGIRPSSALISDDDIVESIIQKGEYQHILKTDMLVIDEIGMISAKTFDTVECICRKLRKNVKYFGGLQVLVIGSFTQLPPVPNKKANDIGEYCFESEIFSKAIPHHVHLTEMMRQKDLVLGKLVQELEVGAPSETSEKLIRTLERPLGLPPQVRPSVLLGTNFAVDMYNQERIHDQHGQKVYYRAIDEGTLLFLLEYLKI